MMRANVIYIYTPRRDPLRKSADRPQNECKSLIYIGEFLRIIRRAIRSVEELTPPPESTTLYCYIPPMG